MPENDDAATTGTPAAATPEGAGAATVAGNGMDYDARLRSEHEFAMKMAKEHQARADRAEQENRQYRSFRQKAGDQLAQFVEVQGGGDAVFGFLKEYDTLLTNPEIQKAVNAYRLTGKLELPNGGAAVGGSQNGQGSDESEYLTTEEKEIRQLRQQNNELMGRLGNVELTTGRSAIDGHLEKLFSNYVLEPTQVEQVKRHVTSALNQFQQSGNVKALQDLQGPNGYMIARSLALATLDDEIINKGAERARLRKQGQLGRLATDGPLATNSRGEPPPVFKNPADAIAWHRANPDAHDSY